MRTSVPVCWLIQFVSRARMSSRSVTVVVICLATSGGGDDGSTRALLSQKMKRVLVSATVGGGLFSGQESAARSAALAGPERGDVRPILAGRRAEAARTILGEID